MARAQAKIFTSIWSDEEFVRVPEPAQRLYLLLLSQSKLNLAGCLDLMPARWARMGPSNDTAAVEASLSVLSQAGFVVIDGDELVIRSFVRHDMRGTINRNIVKGLWSAWSGIMSPVLRRVVVENIPETLWTFKGVDPPAEALAIKAELTAGPTTVGTIERTMVPTAVGTMVPGDRLDASTPYTATGDPHSEPRLEPWLEPQFEPSVRPIPPNVSTSTSFISSENRVRQDRRPWFGADEDHDRSVG